MLTELEKRELLEMAASPALAQEFRALRRTSRSAAPREMDMDLLLGWLSCMSRFAADRRPERPPRDYARALL